jgi:hypothetical protein
MKIIFFLGNMPLFSSGKKSPAELVKVLHESLNIIDKEQSGKKNEKVKFCSILKMSELIF